MPINKTASIATILKENSLHVYAMKRIKKCSQLRNATPMETNGVKRKKKKCNVLYHALEKRKKTRVCQQASIDNADAYTFRVI